MNETRVLIEEIRKSREALLKIETFLVSTRGELGESGPGPEKAIVIADLLAKYYTCLETIFLRVSQLFENNLSDDRWHVDLLDKMTLSITGMRDAVIGDETRSLLLELLKFRHFTRYYYDIAYDWDRLDFLMKKFDQVRPKVSRDLDHFVDFLTELHGEGK
jgi:hypothetical protein